MTPAEELDAIRAKLTAALTAAGMDLPNEGYDLPHEITVEDNEHEFRLTIGEV